MGFYSSSQFFGAFLGGVMAGFLLQEFGVNAVYLTLGGVCLVWFIAVLLYLTPIQDQEAAGQD